MQESNKGTSTTGFSHPKVSVCVVTYNQKYYISQCLQSLVDQITDFPFEVIVADDCSTDGTSEIVAAFERRYPQIVRHIRHEENIGPYRNYQFVHRMAQRRGEYIAHVDGDDYTLPGKLAVQVAILDAHPEIALSAHAVEVVGKNQIIGAAANLPEWGTMEDLLALGTYFVNSSTMYRAQNRFEHNENLDVIDFYMYIEQVSRGGIHLKKTPLGAYRWNPGGISKNRTHRKRIEKSYELAFELALHLGAPAELVKKGKLTRRKSFAVNRLANGDLPGFRRMIALGVDEWFFASNSHRFLSVGRHLIHGYLRRALLARLSSIGDTHQEDGR